MSFDKKATGMISTEEWQKQIREHDKEIIQAEQDRKDKFLSHRCFRLADNLEHGARELRETLYDLFHHNADETDKQNAREKLDKLFKAWTGDNKDASK